MVERDWSCLLAYLWEATAILKEEKVEKENGYEPVSDSTSLKSYSFISDTVLLTSVLNLAASLRFTEHLLLYDSKAGIIIRIKSFSARVKPSKKIRVSFCYLLIIFNRGPCIWNLLKSWLISFNVHISHSFIV